MHTLNSKHLHVVGGNLGLLVNLNLKGAFSSTLQWAGQRDPFLPISQQDRNFLSCFFPSPPKFVHTVKFPFSSVSVSVFLRWWKKAVVSWRNYELMTATGMLSRELQNALSSSFDAFFHARLTSDTLVCSSLRNFSSLFITPTLLLCGLVTLLPFSKAVQNAIKVQVCFSKAFHIFNTCVHLDCYLTKCAYTCVFCKYPVVM